MSSAPPSGAGFSLEMRVCGFHGQCKTIYDWDEGIRVSVTGEKEEDAAAVRVARPYKFVCKNGKYSTFCNAKEVIMAVGVDGREDEGAAGEFKE